MSKKELTLAEAIACGMKPILDELMPNGEKRFRRMHEDGSGYILTEAPPDEAKWQNAHYHKATYELYVVQKGSVRFALLNYFSRLKIWDMMEGEAFLVRPNVHHNVLVMPGSVIHTLKYGECPAGDWHASPELDAFCKEEHKF